MWGLTWTWMVCRQHNAYFNMASEATKGKWSLCSFPTVMHWWQFVIVFLLQNLYFGTAGHWMSVCWVCNDYFEIEIRKCLQDQELCFFQVDSSVNYEFTYWQQVEYCKMGKKGVSRSWCNFSAWECHTILLMAHQCYWDLAVPRRADQPILKVLKESC